MWTIIARDATGTEVARAVLTDKPLSIGRVKERDLVLPLGSVSRKHARIEMRNGKPYLLDEGSANGTAVNGRRVVTPVELADGNLIEITPFRLTVEGPPAEDEDEKTVMLRRPVAIPPRPTAAPPPPPPAPSAPPLRPAAPAPANVISSGPPPLPTWTPPPPPPPPKPRPPPLEEPKFIIPETARATPAAPAAPVTGGDWDSAASELDRQIQSMRSYREQSDVTHSRAAQLDHDWQKLVLNLQSVKQRLAGNPRLLVFNFGRDHKDVTIKLEDKRQRLGYRYFLISRHHPDGKYPGTDSLWLRETGREDMDFRDAKAAQSELLQRVAVTLA